MRWKGRRQSSNVEDRRGRSSGGGSLPGGFGRSGGRIRLPSGGTRRAGGGLSGIIVLVVLFFVLRACGIDPLGMLTGEPGGGSQTTTTQRQETGGASDEMKQFVSVVLAETEDTWNGIFESQGLDYKEPSMVLFSDSVRSACGFASAATGPFYCPGDEKVYIDLSFFDQLARRFGATGDFAQAYVVAHEVGHHVQNVTGILPRFNQMRQRMSQAEANAMSIRVELQADCFAGIWAHYTAQKGLLEDGDIEEALNAANQIGDDTLQRRTQGYVVPESFNHGTSQQRRTWFARGLKSGRLADCDTFNDPI
ncbi:zinc metallopeptidase [Nitratireductor aquimarinus]|uniref:Neutral zinc metallopeptidase n=1 Tax=Nitratireductor aquimarinus TaxID=889300 RepID=A0ABU4AFV8_9HYPH|nr:neutral zinc metallopeptidase [Nitratireductor aquimarinus]MBN8242744.1 zinc metallopeptidase [Nitratireductor aquimarinus]MBY6131844.1 zinc metallopeptidase [Nitratireductor aquimarinus]MCA1301381.1 zinc metallopeptidase [Nitratireductor aquimarinus]MDV6225106.1 neutral zinc metallopeptidase [Nitratireductor aquimarinus]